MDTLIAKVKSLLGNKCANMFMNRKYMKVVPMASQKEAAESLIDFTVDVGIPETLVMDGTPEFTGKHTDFNKQASQMWKKNSIQLNKEGRTSITRQNGKLDFYPNVGSYKCRRKMSILGCGITV